MFCHHPRARFPDHCSSYGSSEQINTSLAVHIIITYRKRLGQALRVAEEIIRLWHHLFHGWLGVGLITYIHIAVRTRRLSCLTQEPTDDVCGCAAGVLLFYLIFVKHVSVSEGNLNFMAVSFRSFLRIDFFLYWNLEPGFETLSVFVDRIFPGTRRLCGFQNRMGRHVHEIRCCLVEDRSIGELLLLVEVGGVIQHLGDVKVINTFLTIDLFSGRFGLVHLNLDLRWVNRYAVVIFFSL